MDALPIWPPLVALGIGVIAYAAVYWQSRRFDRLYGRRDD